MEVGQPQQQQPPPQPTRRPGGSGSTGSARSRERPYRGIRMRKWGKWVAEIREPNKRSRIWLGSYFTPVAAARAYDTAVFFLRGRSARLNFPDDVDQYAAADGLSASASGVYSTAFIRKKATEVGARVDALLQLQEEDDDDDDGSRRLVPRIGLHLDLNERPSSDEDDLDFMEQ